MPKVIKNLDQNIRETAKDLFRSQGFEQTNMRQIAQQTNIAVGTLYHYYKDKENLYLQVLIDTWLQIKNELETLATQATPLKTTFQRMIASMITQMKEQLSFIQLWQEIAKMHNQIDTTQGAESEFQGMHTQFNQLFSQTLTQILDHEPSSSEKNTIEKLGSFAFIMAVNSCDLPFNEIEQQSKLITNIIISYLNQSNLSALQTSTPQSTKKPKENTIKWS